MQLIDGKQPLDTPVVAALRFPCRPNALTLWYGLVLALVVCYTTKLNSFLPTLHISLPDQAGRRAARVGWNHHFSI